MLSSDPAFSEADLQEATEDISLRVSWAIYNIFHAHGISAYEVDVFHKPILKAVGKKLFRLAEANFEAWFE